MLKNAKSQMKNHRKKSKIDDTRAKSEAKK